MDRSNPYETAFESFLKEQGLCYVAVDETRRAVLGDVPVKNLDFIILGPTGAKLLVDVKGRRFPGGTPEKPRYVWESWATRDDIDGLTHWHGLFGLDYQPLFVFMYKIMPSVTFPDDTPDVWHHKGETYLLRAVTLEDYSVNMKVRSPKWGTVWIQQEKFQELARPFRYYSHERPVNPADEENDGPDQARHLSEVTRAALQAFVSTGTGAWSGRRRTRRDRGVGPDEPDSDRPT